MKMDLLNYRNIKKCQHFVPIYKRPTKYIEFNYKGVDIVASYDSYDAKRKSVKILRESRKLKLSHIFHIISVYLYFKDMGKEVRGVEITLENKVHYFSERWIMRKLPLFKKEVESFKIPKEKTPGNHCKFCKIKIQCHKEMIKNGDLSVVPGISKSYMNLLKDLNINPIKVVESNKIEQVPPQFRKPLYNLKSLLENKPIIINKFDIPKKYIIYDVETYRDLDFLHGILVKGKYKPYLNVENTDDNLERFLKFIDSTKETIVHYDVYDIKRLQMITKNISHLYKYLYKIEDRSYDLYEKIQKNIALPVTSYSLKDISKFFGYKWRTDLNGYAIFIEYKNYLRGHKESLEKIIKYNEDDCRATAMIMESLRELM
ncbi:TM0106 family RecB-like putative nuclease [Marinitoga aeolica]|uniref:TM0106 family RecB-like putative nuclease n=1 Tax=Marinitoga aeolica TaxID=2809031 RepID=A0ABY8PTN4_9BACT|nr:TM0106 family RecB-like putative nuclease [Marinitoga aeolica]WGS66005.1 TM0106 family RecB-like putative nuclease [Marinitoga aeolica]